MNEGSAVPGWSRIARGELSGRSIVGVIVGLFAVTLTGCSLVSGGGPPATAPAMAAPSTTSVGPSVPASAAWLRAIEAGTRTEAGTPGQRAWRNSVSYRIEAELDPDAATVRGREVVIYRNASPNTLPSVVLNLYQNIFSEGVPRNRYVPITGGVTLHSVTANGVALERLRTNQVPILFDAPTAPTGYSVQGTLARIRLPRPIAPGDSAVLEIEWDHVVPPAPSFRTGWEDALGARAFQVAQWYPQIAMFDDLTGWDATPYLGDGEFYTPFGDFDVSITVPAGHLVGATGSLANPTEVLTEEAIARLAAALGSDSVTRIVTDADVSAENTTLPSISGTLTWRFTAEDIRDFAFATSSGFVWDATTARVDDGAGGSRPVAVHALYRIGAPSWERAATFGQDAIEFMSDFLLPYPYGNLTIAEGPIGGMEYPALIFIGKPGVEDALYAVIAHETAHQWFPMLTGSDEARFAWLDEGFATYLENLAVARRYSVDDPFALDRESYRAVAGSDREVPLMRHTDLATPYGDRYIAAYAKPSLLLRSLEEIVGTEVFRGTLNRFLREWTLRGPSPWDFFAAFESAAGRDLDWFFGPWWFETSVLDQAIADVAGAETGRAIVTVESRGGITAPVRVRGVTTAGDTAFVDVGVDRWAGGTRSIDVVLDAPGPITRITLEGPLPDVDAENDVWTVSPP